MERNDAVYSAPNCAKVYQISADLFAQTGLFLMILLLKLKFYVVLFLCYKFFGMLNIHFNLNK